MNIEKTQSGPSRTAVRLCKEDIESLCRGNTLTFHGFHTDRVVAITGPENCELTTTSKWIPFREKNQLPSAYQKVWVTLSDNRVVSGSFGLDKWQFDAQVPESCKVIAWMPIVPYRVDDDEVVDSIQEVKDSLDSEKYARVIDALDVAQKRVASSKDIIALLDSFRSKDTFNEIKGLYDYIRKMAELRDKIGSLIYGSDWEELKGRLVAPEKPDLGGPCQ